MSKIPSDDILESLYIKGESAQLKTVLELCDIEIHQTISTSGCWGEGERDTWIIETGAKVKSRKGLIDVESGQGTCY